LYLIVKGQTFSFQSASFAAALECQWNLKTRRGDELRERVAMGIMVLIMIFLFAFVFAVLGKGEYEPGALAPPPYELVDPA